MYFTTKMRLSNTVICQTGLCQVIILARLIQIFKLSCMHVEPKIKVKCLIIGDPISDRIAEYCNDLMSCEPRTTSAIFLGSISAELPTNTCPGGVSRHLVSYSRKVSIKGSNFPKNPLFQSTLFVISLRVTGNVLRRLYSHPTDVPFLGDFAEGCTVFQLSTSESVLISNRHTWMGTESRHLARGGTLLNRPITNMKQHHSPGGATIGYVRLGSPIGPYAVVS